jgi:hypothetical protein
VSAITDTKHKALVDWVDQSSRPRPAPLGREVIDNGPVAVFAPVAIDTPPLPVLSQPQLCVYLPTPLGFTIPYRIRADTAGPTGTSYGSFEERLSHIIKAVSDGRFQVCVIALPSPSETLRYRMDRQLPGLDLSQDAVIFLPVWQMAPDLRAWATRNTPIYR